MLTNQNELTHICKISTLDSSTGLTHGLHISVIATQGSNLKVLFSGNECVSPNPISLTNRFRNESKFALYSKVVKSGLALTLQDALGIFAEKLASVYSPGSMDLSSPDRHSSEPSSSSDAALLDDLKAKQPAALGCLYDRYGSVVYGVALKVLQSQPEAEDLTQEIFLSLWQRPVDPAKHGHLMRYLIAMTRTRAIDKL